MKQKTVKFNNGVQDYDIVINHANGEPLNMLFKPALHATDIPNLQKMLDVVSEAFEQIENEFEAENKKLNPQSQTNDQAPDFESVFDKTFENADDQKTEPEQTTETTETTEQKQTTETINQEQAPDENK
jgi:hypothetical protein